MTQDTPTQNGGNRTGLAAYLGPEILAGLDTDRAIIMLWSLDGVRIHAASRPAIRFFGGFSSEDLTGRRFGPALPSTAKLAELARFLAKDEPPRIERLRFFIGSRSDLLTCVCRRVSLLTGEEGLLVVSADNRNVADLRGAARWLDPAPEATVPPAEKLERQPSAADLPPSETVSDVARSGPNASDPLPETPETTAEETIAASPAKPHPAPLSSLPRRPVRFVFQTDRAGRIEQLSPQLAAVVGEARAALIGHSFAEMDNLVGTSGGQDVAARVERGESWQGMTLHWPVGATALRVPVELSGLPIHDAGRTPRGFRGFGVIRLDTVSEEKLLEAERGVPSPDNPDIEAPNPETTLAEPLSAAAASTAVPQPSAPATPRQVASVMQPTGANENADLPQEAPRPELQPTISAPRPLSPSEADPEQRLSQTDRNAFREIARALGARLADDMPDPPGMTRRTRSESGIEPAQIGLSPRLIEPETTPPPAVLSPEMRIAPVPTAPAPIAPVSLTAANDAGPDTAPRLPEPTSAEIEADDTSAPVPVGPGVDDDLLVAPMRPPISVAETIIDHLPIGVLVARGDEVLFANRTLFDLVGCEDIAAFTAMGVAHELLVDRHPDEATEPAGVQRRSVGLGDGSRMDVLAHVQPIDWHGGLATLVALRSATLPHSSVANAEIAHPVAVATPTPDLAAIESLTTDLRQQLRTVESEREEFRAILDTATDGVISLDSEGRITGLNKSAEALFGFDQNDVAGQRFSALLAGESHASALDYLEGLKSGGVASVLNDGREVIGREKKGGRIPLFMTLGRISERDSGRFCAVLRDLTAWKKAEAELTESKRVAERASQMKSDFLAKISHEIRTPMNAIIGFSEVMRTEQFGPIGSERYRDYLGDIHRSGEHVISLVNDLLDLSKIEAGRAELSFTSVSLNEIVADCVSMMQPQAARDRVIMRSNLTEKMPRVVADERSIKQVVLNLLSNACKFNQPGGQVIVSTALSDHDEAVIRVRDTGIGMSEKDIEGAMQPFRQMSPTRRGGGTGLGLPLTKALVEANRASLVLRSAVTEGTLAEVIFPATRVLAE